MVSGWLIRGGGSGGTEAVVEGLDTGKADLDHDQLVSVDDLYGYVYDRVTETTPSQPQTRNPRSRDRCTSPAAHTNRS